ncbi:MAG: ketoacyl-ACP synthase III, partial [Anaerolineales bacterium]|nr:ketoacyl-ACP synthase III [Anaerolineales bacterium]
MTDTSAPPVNGHAAPPPAKSAPRAETSPRANGHTRPPRPAAHARGHATTNGGALLPYAHIVGWGMAVPERVMTNDDLARLVDTTDEWIVARTGIRERRIAGPKETTATLSAEAGRLALEVADVAPEDVDLVIVATSTPEHAFPSTASLVQDALGAENAGAFDLAAACTGFIYGLAMGSAAIRSGTAQNVLVIGAETLSRVVNWKDRGTCILFGDGAGAFLLQGRASPGGILSTLLRSDGSGGDSLIIPAGGSKLPATYDTVRDNQHTIHMDGKEVYRFATRVMTSAVKEVVEAAGLTLEQLRLIVPHQANKRIIESSAKSLGLPEDKFILNLDRYGNTSAASIPIAVCEAVAQGRLRPDDHLVLVGFGAGLTWGSALL